MQPEFDRYAAQGYAELLQDPILETFGPGSRFFHARKFILLRDFCRRFGIRTESVNWLDVGCGEGGLLALGKPYFGMEAGCDVSAGMMQHCEGLDVRRMESACRIPFGDGTFDLVTAVCVYHHVDENERLALTADILRVLSPKGIFCMIEHNPFNPVTRLIVSRSPVDVEAHLLRAATARGLVRAVKMKVLETQYFLYFPERFYTKMAAIEAKLSAIPFGGQYAIFSRKT